MCVCVYVGGLDRIGRLRFQVSRGHRFETSAPAINASYLCAPPMRYDAAEIKGPGRSGLHSNDSNC